MKRVMSVIGVVVVLLGWQLARHKNLAASDCNYDCPVVAVCDFEDVDDICKGCVIGAGGPSDPNGCDGKDHKDYNPDGIQYHGSVLGGTHQKADNTVACIRVKPCHGSYFPKTWCQSFIVYSACSGSEPATNCWDCFLGEPYDVNHIEQVCFDCEEE